MDETTDDVDEPGGEVYRCRNCGRGYEFDNEQIDCWCDKRKTVVVKPCGICGDPITTAEICAECGEETDGDAMTPTWGKHRYGDEK